MLYAGAFMGYITFDLVNSNILIFRVEELMGEMKNNKALWIILGVVALFIIIYFLAIAS
jgi:hypothetical protein